MDPESNPDKVTRPKFKLLVVTYAALAMILGCICIAITPMGQSNDTWTHIYRIDSILNGDLFPHRVDSTSPYHSVAEENYGGAVDWGFVTLSYNNQMWDAGYVSLDSIVKYDDLTADVPFNNTAVYNPVSYMPYLATLTITKLLGTPAWIAYYAMEVAGLLFFVIVTAAAVLYLPKYRVPLAVLLLMLYVPPLFFPLDLYWYLTPFTINPENILFAFATLFVCLLLRAFWGNPSNRLLFCLMVAGLVCSITKFVYLPLIFTSLILLLSFKKTKDVQKQKQISKSGKWIIVLGCFFCVIITLCWIQAATYFATSPYKLTYQQVQLKTHILFTQPLDVIGQISEAVAWHHSFYEASGNAIYLFEIVFVATIILMIIAAILKAINKRHLVFINIQCLAVALIVYAIYLALWLQFTSFTDVGIDGVQGRYFFPLFPLMLLIICGLADNLHLLYKRSKNLIAIKS